MATDPQYVPTDWNYSVTSTGDDRPSVMIGQAIEKIGVEPGDSVKVEKVGNGLVVTPSGVEWAADAPETPSELPQGVESSHEATIVGNRLWQRGETLKDMGLEHIGEETQALARRFHELARESGGAD